jgi:hypothetical protein
MTDLVRFLTDFVFEILLIPTLVVLAFLTLYLPSLIITRVYYFRRKQGPAMRFLSRPVGPSIPGRGADRRALRHALTLWAMLGLKTGSCATALLVIGSGYALFGVAVEGRVEIAFYTVMFTAFFAAVVSGVECVFLLVRLALHGPRNPANSLMKRTSKLRALRLLQDRARRQQSAPVKRDRAYEPCACRTVVRVLARQQFGRTGKATSRISRCSVLHCG